MVKVKICGLRRKEDIEAANQFHPDYIGFVFAKSKREVTDEKALELKAMLNPEIQAVGVFVNEQPSRIEMLCKKRMIDIVQLHGDEDENYIRELKKRIPNPVIKALRVRSREQIQKAEELPCEYLLLDTYVKGEYGGSGKTFDWRIIPDIKKPYFLAGGIMEENVQEALESCCPYAVDVSSAVETDGWKDAKKMERLIRKVRSQERNRRTE